MGDLVQFLEGGSFFEMFCIFSGYNDSLFAQRVFARGISCIWNLCREKKGEESKIKTVNTSKSTVATDTNMQVNVKSADLGVSPIGVQRYIHSDTA